MSLPASFVSNPGGLVQVAASSGYTNVTSTGTSTIKAEAGIFYGISAVAVGTSVTVSAVDGANVILGTATVTAANQAITALPSGVGQRFSSLAVIVTGTSPNINVLWD